MTAGVGPAESKINNPHPRMCWAARRGGRGRDTHGTHKKRGRKPKRGSCGTPTGQHKKAREKRKRERSERALPIVAVIFFLLLRTVASLDTTPSHLSWVQLRWPVLRRPEPPRWSGRPAAHSQPGSQPSWSSARLSSGLEIQIKTLEVHFCLCVRVCVWVPVLKS